MSALCPPAAATSSARLTSPCPRTSEKSGPPSSRVAVVWTRGGTGVPLPSRSANSSNASASVATGYTASPSTTAASAAFAAGTTIARRPSSRAPTAIGSTPRTGRTAPSSPSSPTIATSSSTDCAISPSPVAASRPSASGRS